MDLEELRGFLAVVESGSLLGAATRLGIPRGTLRRRIDALEARAGVPLLERNASGVTPTEAGRLLAQRGRQLVADGAALIAAARDLGRESPKTLRLRLPVGTPPSALVAHVQLSRALLPKLIVSIQVHEDPLAGPLDEVDLVLHFGHGHPSSAWLEEEVLSVPLRVMASPGYLSRHGEPRTVAELAHHPLGTWLRPGGDPRRWPMRHGGLLEIAPILHGNDAHLLRQHARAGLALVLLPDGDLDLLGLRMDELVPVLEAEIGDQLPLCMSMRAGLADDPTVGRILRSMRQLLARTRGGRPPLHAH
ncbi:LysR family transcriptional regulator [Paraliomyxa miuraensis]|uniref:LysR family transcriptional regulator n=1 Tax=Paraliomyxa miuraensis TaxID=376150 RepID=UPI0022559841|nr:LysR family transcriptional regulator [Paraliomyxa miuraensis]MCX4240451.1 LysR family transcriptional regulator [Paraliomyxa miuraensis]